MAEGHGGEAGKVQADFKKSDGVVAVEEVVAEVLVLEEVGGGGVGSDVGGVGGARGGGIAAAAACIGVREAQACGSCGVDVIAC